MRHTGYRHTKRHSKYKMFTDENEFNQATLATLSRLSTHGDSYDYTTIVNEVSASLRTASKSAGDAMWTWLDYAEIAEKDIKRIEEFLTNNKEFSDTSYYETTLEYIKTIKKRIEYANTKASEIEKAVQILSPLADQKAPRFE
jgi:hypothetical protein